MNVHSTIPLSLSRLRKPTDYAAYVRLQERLRKRRREMLIFCSHPRVLTAGVQSKESSLRVDRSEAALRRIPILEIGRGGDFTAHEPGQCVVYPHIDLKRRGLSIGSYFQSLLEVTAASVRSVWNLGTHTLPHAPGLYADSNGAKIASIGVMFKGFFTSFGLALNVDNDLETFSFIHPCGFPAMRMTTIAREGGDPEKMDLFAEDWADQFASWIREASGRKNQKSST